MSYYYRKGTQIHAAIGEFLFEKFSYYEDVHLNKQDTKCFSCAHFGCNEAGDILCEKDSGTLKTRDNITVVHCNKHKWYKK